jgi:hypothetical protein
VIVGSLLAGLSLSWIISLISDISTGFSMRKKDSKIKDYKKDMVELTRTNHQLELENTKIRAETNKRSS